MKNVKKFFLIIAMIMSLVTSAFAASDFEFILSSPFRIPSKETNDISALAISDYGRNGYSFGYTYIGCKAGLLPPKLDISVISGAIAIGIGGGVKNHLAGKLVNDYINVTEKYIPTVVETKKEIELKRNYITDIFSPSIIGYMKVTFDYYLFFSDNIEMNLGLYLYGNFNPKYKEIKIGSNVFEIGIQLWFRFGQKV